MITIILKSELAKPYTHVRNHPIGIKSSDEWFRFQSTGSTGSTVIGTGYLLPGEAGKSLTHADSCKLERFDRCERPRSGRMV